MQLPSLSVHLCDILDSLSVLGPDHKLCSCSHQHRGNTAFHPVDEKISRKGHKTQVPKNKNLFSFGMTLHFSE